MVTSPLDPELVTEGEIVSECFMMARDALKGLRESRAKPLRQADARRSRRSA